MSRNKKFVALIALLLVFSFALAGCGGSKPAAPAAEGTGSDPNFPEVKWTMQTTWSQGWLIHDGMPVVFADRVRAMTGGKFDIEVLPAGAIVGGLEVLDACNAGTIDAYHSWTGYWLNKHPAAPLFASTPMGFEPDMSFAWLYAGGGKEFMARMFEEMQMNVVAYPLGITHPEILVHSNKPVGVMEDFKGLKYRAPGWWGEILRSTGVNVTLLPSPELYPSMEKGVIDAVEFNIPMVNKQMGFDEVSKYIAGPGMHQPTCVFEVGFNKDKYDALPQTYKDILWSASVEATVDSWTTGIVGDLEVLKEWQSNDKWTLQKFNAEDQHAIRKLSWDYIDGQVKEKNNALYTEAWTSYKTFFNEFCDFEWFMVPERPIVADKDRMFGAPK
ncbi:MAG: hypothetical protein CVU87_07060 [Firmicutes bacterium HGW-Firmicutes-12]|nr:MAG: hypothetical protein CVU87_07060 [Firmicutes bacterium HGW-Firmicutes-12]